MPTFTLQEIIDQMAAMPRSVPNPSTYLEIIEQGDGYPNPMEAPPEKIVACLIGEAGLQLAHMAIECLDLTDDTGSGDLFEGLLKCIPETSGSIKKFKLSGDAQARYYGPDGEELRKRESFWDYAEHIYCYAHEGEHRDDRVLALVKAGQEFGLDVQVPETIVKPPEVW